MGGRAMGEEDAGTDPRDDPCLSEGAFAGVAWEGCRRSYKVLLVAQHNTHTCRVLTDFVCSDVSVMMKLLGDAWLDGRLPWPLKRL